MSDVPLDKQDFLKTHKNSYNLYLNQLSFDSCSQKVSFTDCPVADRKNFYKASCILPISVGLGLKVHEADRFLGTMKLINASFKECTILLDDTIQRHTLSLLMPDLSQELIYQKAFSEGDQWLQRNQSILDLCTIPIQIKRWDDWLRHPLYSEKNEIVMSLYEQDPFYQQAFHSSIEQFLVRFEKKSQEKGNFIFDYEGSYIACLKYLQEECSVMCLWAESGYGFEVYPTGRNDAMASTYEKIIRQKNPDLLKSVSLHFRKILGSKEKPPLALLSEESKC